VSLTSIRLHAKLYRARAVDRALELARAEASDATLSRRKDGDHHLVTVDGLEAHDAAELLAQVADAALVITAELDRR
jgi:hypothetical protein